MTAMQIFLDASAERHGHLCPRQVIGVRMGMLAAKLLDIRMPQKGKRLLTIVETDGCFADGIEVSTGCSIGHRTLRIRDFGKVAATFADTKSGKAFRAAPHRLARQTAIGRANGDDKHWEAMLQGYQAMSDEELLTVQSVQLTADIKAIVSHAGIRTLCEICQEEIINEREVTRNGQQICLYCAGEQYYDVERVSSADVARSKSIGHMFGSNSKQKP